ncbi:AMP-dependent synthetase/ligase [Bradymonas sediminis]|uniref:AMP-dependent synthetase/ligase domain-containing protein n=1 Tax=Bradymonas sediminis TaxID=1548548 RepID=A0A2Z4FJS7_9DELT|nr:AMP-binding protein [Bradymonas sediminis]AWV89130.1 hypothetical protein DN745_07185 [Bradymonas sediminis]TDP64404.1 long-chain acyl-CoA synthetase [Bradymonas sediminis]
MKHTIVDIFNRRVNAFGPRPALACRQGEGWAEVSWREWWERAECVAAGLMARGLERGERVCILADTRVEWAWLELGIMMAGGVSVPIYPTSTADACAQVLKEVGARFVVVGDATQLMKLVEIPRELGAVDDIVCIEAGEFADLNDALPERLTCGDFEALLAQGRRYLSAHPGRVAVRRRQVAPGDPAMVIYTSGSLGEARGVVHRHEGLVAEIQAWSALKLLGSADRQLLFLPMAQLFSQILFFGALDAGAQTFFGHGLAHIISDMRACKPTFIGGVPRIFEAIYARVVNPEQRSIGVRPGRFRMKGGGGLEFDGPLFEWVLKRGVQLSRIRQQSRPFTRLQKIEAWTYKRLFLEQVKSLFGGEIRFAFCIGAPLRVEVAEFFHAAGVHILEGYGLCEAAGISAVNLPQEYRFGSVGKPLPDVEITIAEDGEVLVRGAMLTRGDDVSSGRQTQEPPAHETGARVAKRWLYTGDLGEFDGDGFLYIRGRKKHLIRTTPSGSAEPGDRERSQARVVFPEMIEERLVQTRLISHAVVYGGDLEEQTPLRALVTLHEGAKTWAIQKGIPFDDHSHLATSPEIQKEVDRIVCEVNETLPEYARIASFKILARPFSLAARELTVSGKLRRDIVLAQHCEWRRPESTQQATR